MRIAREAALLQLAAVLPGPAEISLSAGTVAYTDTWLDVQIVPRDWVYVQNCSGVPGEEEPLYRKASTGDLYPHPAAEKVSFTEPDNIARVTVMDFAGKLILRREQEELKDGSLMLRELDAGLYLIRVSYNDGSETVRKLVKQ